MQFSSCNKRTLIFADPHQDMIRLKYLLSHEDYDQALCLGDWFDSFHYDSNDEVRKTCDVLKEFVNTPNCHTLFGNHDLHYLYKSNYTICSGFESRKHAIVHKSLGDLLSQTRDKFKWYFWLDDWLCTHAGINAYHFPPINFNPTKQGVTVWLNDQVNFANRNLLAGDDHWFYCAGEARGGNMRVGGIAWQDFDCEFQPIPELNQLVGHTPHRTILNHVEDGHVDLTQAHDLDIDCHLSEYLIIDKGKLEIKKYREL